jgi:hypothetical protein
MMTIEAGVPAGSFAFMLRAASSSERIISASVYACEKEENVEATQNNRNVEVFTECPLLEFFVSGLGGEI